MEQENKLNNSINTIKPEEQPKQNNFLISLLSILLLISVLVAGFFAYQTQNLVKELRVMSGKSKPTPIATFIPSPTLGPVKFNNLKSGDTITSPVKLIGTIDRIWTWEATFSIEITDSSKKSLNTLPVNVKFYDDQSETGTFSISIPFTAKTNEGFVIVHADNPSGLPQNNKSIEIPVKFTVDQVACTMDAKICPDGSAVGRSGPKCEFAPCPTPANSKD